MNMLLRYLARYWYVSLGHYGMRAWAASVLRSLRVLRWPGRHRTLCGCTVYHRYVARDADADVFHHLSHRDYLSRHFTPAERVACMLDHYGFESAAFDEDYQRQVYGGGLRLWRHAAGGHEFSIWLKTNQRYLGEGDLNLVMRLGNETLHRIGFNWVDATIAAMHAAIVPFIARNQGRWRDELSDVLYAAFEASFPNNAPAYFCVAAMAGLAAAVGARQLLCVKSDMALSRMLRSKQGYPAAYDSFWDAFGGTRSGKGCHVIPLPFQFKDLQQLASKHRKRAAARRAWWTEIGTAAHTTLHGHLRNAPHANVHAKVSQEDRQ
ncbi:DUF535 domain-containing protein [Massilia forsythiae]|uniref:DUF535 domain-containing protein n=1 Tax=Massilia forsythiae TaxID=2728020 RepID=A0A7Z2ZT06_9BURK|nr:DUF535 family protein [Massilia forsythiae]QJE01061.1 DUF535 domain-containing protein [Massilia forsythiae]